jgi:hypothetical protein
MSVYNDAGHAAPVCVQVHTDRVMCNVMYVQARWCAMCACRCTWTGLCATKHYYSICEYCCTDSINKINATPIINPKPIQKSIGNILLNKLEVKKKGSKSNPSAMIAARIVRDNKGSRAIFTNGESVMVCLYSQGH